MGEEMNDFIIENFNKLCQEFRSVNYAEAGEDEMEPLYEELLGFLQRNAQHRQQLAQLLMDGIRRQRYGGRQGEVCFSDTAIGYCMRELRWPEILAFAQQESSEFHSRKMSTALHSILEAYDDEWPDAVFFRRFGGGRDALGG